MKIYKIRVTREVLDTVNATRRADVYGEVLTFGREPVYVRAVELPPQLADDRYLHIETVDSAPSVVVVIDLKSERVQEPVAASDEELDLKSERVQEPESVAPGEETDLKSERVQEPAAAAPAYAAPSRRKRG
jgi:hypothetical protein